MRTITWMALMVVPLIGGCGTSPVVKSVRGTANESSSVANIGTYYLPRKLIRIQLSFDDKGALVPPDAGKGAIFSEIVVPHRPMRIYMTSGHDYADKLKIELNNGFLQKITNDSSDKKPEVIASMADQIASIIGSTPPASVAAKATGQSSKRQNLMIDELIDPLLDVGGNGILNQSDFNTKYGGYAISLSVSHLLDASAFGDKVGDKDELKGEVAGVLFPAMISSNLRLNISGDEGAPSVIATAQFALPSTKHFFKVDVSRTAWVQHKTTIDFDSGIFKSIDVERGSVTASVAKVPVDVLKAIFSIPTELFQFKVNHASGQKSVVDAQQELIESNQSLIAAQIAYEEKLKESKGKSDTDAPGD